MLIVDTDAHALAALILQHSEKRNLSFRQISLNAELGESTVSLFMRGERSAGLEFCKKIAPVLGIAPERALQLAGQLEEQPALSDKQHRLLDAVRAVPNELIDTALVVLYGLSGAGPAPKDTAPADRQPSEPETLQLDLEAYSAVKYIYQFQHKKPPPGPDVPVTAELVEMLLQHILSFYEVMRPFFERETRHSPEQQERAQQFADEERQRREEPCRD